MIYQEGKHLVRCQGYQTKNNIIDVDVWTRGTPDAEPRVSRIYTYSYADSKYKRRYFVLVKRDKRRLAGISS